MSTGTGKLKMAGGVSGETKESINRAFGYLRAHKVEFGLGSEVDNSDFHVEVIDLLNNKVAAELGIGFFVAVFSALRKSPVTAGTLILGDMSIQGNIKRARSLTEPLQIAMDREDKEKKENWFKEWFLPVLEHIDIRCLTWEQIISDIRNNDLECGNQVSTFYKSCLRYNRSVSR